MIRLSDKSAAEIAEMKLLWKENFGDSDEFIDFYFDKICVNNKIVVMREHAIISENHRLFVLCKQASSYLCGKPIYYHSIFAENQTVLLITVLINYISLCIVIKENSYG